MRRLRSATTSASSRPCASAWSRLSERSGKTDEELEHAIRQIVSGAIAGDEVIDVFTAAGLDKPDISLLSDEFMEEVGRYPYKNVAVELLQRLLNEEIKTRERKQHRPGPIVRANAAAVAPCLREPLDPGGPGHRGTDRHRQEMREAERRGEQLGLTRRSSRSTRLGRQQEREEAWANRSCGDRRRAVDSVRQNATSTGPSARPCARSFAWPCDAFSGSTAIRRTCRKWP